MSDQRYPPLVAGDSNTLPGRPSASTPTTLSDLAAWLGSSTPLRTAGDLDVAITGMSLSTQRIQPGDLYAALPGARAHGAAFAPDALASGAVGVITDEDGARLLSPRTPVLVVEHPRHVLGRLAARIYGEPATAMRMIGVTGTQGKTTTTRLLDDGLAAAGITGGVIGTVGTRVAGADIKTSLTTPEAPDLHGLFALMRERGVEVCAMEVSSQGLVLGRVDGVVFDVATFLNLGRDHLDFHLDLEAYFAAKASLFTPERARVGLTNIDDEFGRRLLQEATIPMQTFSMHGAADWQATDIALGGDGSMFTVLGPGGITVPTRVPVPGAFNVSNALAALASAALAGLEVHRVADGIGQGPGVPGRLEQVDAGQDFVLVVDYAHKPDAVEAVVSTLRPLTEGQLIVVLGAGGDRDPGKRAIMGEIAARLADVLIVTDDNPRTEEPAAIRAAVLAGTAHGTAEVVEIGDRRAAIAEAVRRARPGDVVLVAGKGHETGQEIEGEVHPFDDRIVAAQAVARVVTER